MKSGGGGLPGRAQPFSQLYLSNVAQDPSSARGDAWITLQSAPARACGVLLEMLYVPIGRSGSEEESYLLYEDRVEFDAAVRMARELDVGVVDGGVSTVGAEAAFRAGVGMFLGIARAGVMVEEDRVRAAEHKLAEAIQSEEMPRNLRWGAAVLASRLVAEYRYDYETSGSFLSQAEKQSDEGSLERMSVMWWQADLMRLRGKTGAELNLYQAIVDGFEESHHSSQIVRRCKSNLEEAKKRR